MSRRSTNGADAATHTSSSLATYLDTKLHQKGDGLRRLVAGNCLCLTALLRVVHRTNASLHILHQFRIAEFARLLAEAKTLFMPVAPRTNKDEKPSVAAAKIDNRQSSRAGEEKRKSDAEDDRENSVFSDERSTILPKKAQKSKPRTTTWRACQEK